MSNETPSPKVNHPWVEAAGFMDPEPVPTGAKFSRVEVEIDGKNLPLAMLSIATPNGVHTTFYGIDTLQNLLRQGAVVLQELANQPPSGIVVANPQQQRQYQGQADAVMEAARRMRGNNA